MNSIKNTLRFLLSEPEKPKLRGFTQLLLDTFKDKPIIGAEIGVYKGGNAGHMLENLNIKRLYLVDPYESYKDNSKLGYKNMNECYEFAKNYLKPFSSKIEFVKLYSSDAVNFISSKLDFVYIDANHSYDFIKQDINLWFQKLKPNGYIGGHNFQPRYSGVARAVIEFADEHGLKICGNGVDWWYFKSNLRDV